MTLSTTQSLVQHLGNGVTLSFPVPFRTLKVEHLRVTQELDGIITPITGFTGAGLDQDAGGTITLLEAPPSGALLSIRRIVPSVQETDYVEGDPFPAETHEAALDYLTMLIQQLEQQDRQQLTVPDGGLNLELPPASVRANTHFAWDALGQPIASDLPDENKAAIDEHQARRDNPHAVTAGQVGAFAKAEADARFINTTGDTMTGALSVPIPTDPSHAVNKLALDQAIAGLLTLPQADARFINTTGDTMTGALLLSGAPTAPLQAATKDYIDEAVAPLITSAEADARFINATGDTMAGALFLAVSPTEPLQAATKYYVDEAVAGLPPGGPTEGITKEQGDLWYVNATGDTMTGALDVALPVAGSKSLHLRQTGVPADPTIRLGNASWGINWSGSLIEFVANGGARASFGPAAFTVSVPFNVSHNNAAGNTITQAGAGPGLDIIHTGTGPALRVTAAAPTAGDIFTVEDSTRPDATPFIIKNDGRVGIGKTAPSALLDVAGDITAAGVLTVPEGSVSAPAIRFAGDADTGFCHVDEDRIGVVTGAFLAMTIGDDLIDTRAPLLLHDDPVADLQAATKQYVDAKGTLPSGTRLLFQQTAAPTGWTKDTTLNDRALRVVSGTAGGGGTLDFSAAFASRPLSGAVQPHTPTVNHIASHQHLLSGPVTSGNTFMGGTGWNFQVHGTEYAGGSWAHDHPLAMNNLNMEVRYTDVIVATKD